MRIAVVGTGYVGLVSGTCFAELGVGVVCVDTDARKVQMLREGRVTIHEPGLEDMVLRNMQAGRLAFTTSLEEVLEAVEMVFIAVGTPSSSDGSADLRYVYDVAKTIGENITNHKLVVLKSTVPVGTTHRVQSIIEEGITARGLEIEFDVASNPEFLKEGDAINDFMRPDRVVVGVETERAKQMMTELYKPMLLNNFRVIFMDIISSELTKYAANAMLSTRISFMNEIAALCAKTGANITSVRHGIGSDSRIGNRFLYAGCGYGGSCFPKDARALINTAREHGLELQILEAVERVNESQKELLFEFLMEYYNGNVANRKVTIWGLAFKPGTDDIRDAPSIVLIKRLLEAGCRVVAFDPIAMQNTRETIGEIVEYAPNIYDSVKGSEALFHVTEWKQFRMPDWQRIRGSMKTPLIIDGRNVFDPDHLEGFSYYGVGIPPRIIETKQ